ncbi:glycosyltransferase family 2 protein [Rhizobium sp. BR 314]|uniref:glycosyltransferase family 2 protein n=1 Tax=Rhizobium sp. BR 314 TaxID=3040013 RepID=UPI0039BF893B
MADDIITNSEEQHDDASRRIAAINRDLDAILAQQQQMVDLYVEGAELLQGLFKDQQDRFALLGNQSSMESAAGQSEVQPIDFVVPVYNSLHHARLCITSILRYATPPYHLFVVDDKGDSHTSRELAAMVSGLDNVTLIAHSQNVGYLKSVNEALGLGRAEICVLVNSDAMLSPGACERLRDGFVRDAQIGVITAVSTWANWTKIPFPPGTNMLDLREFIARQNDLGIADIGNASGFFFAVRRKLFDTLGLFDEAYNPGYWEETDFCMLALEKGWRVVVDRQLYIYHHGWGSFQSSGRDVHMARNRSTFMARWERQYAALDANWRFHNPTDAVSSRLAAVSQTRSDKPRILFVSMDGRRTEQSIALIQLVNGLVAEGISANIVYLSGIDESLLDMTPMYFRPLIIEASVEQIRSYNIYVGTCEKTSELIEAFDASLGAALFSFVTSDRRSPLLRHSPKEARPIARIPGLTNTRGDVPCVLPGVNLDIFYPRDTPRSSDVLLCISEVAWRLDRAGIIRFCGMLSEAMPGIRLAATGLAAMKTDLPAIAHRGSPHRMTELANCYSEAEIVLHWGAENQSRLTYLEIAACGGIAMMDVSSAEVCGAEHMKNSLLTDSRDPQSMVATIIGSLQSPLLLATLRNGALSTANSCPLRAEAAQMASIFLEAGTASAYSDTMQKAS